MPGIRHPSRIVVNFRLPASLVARMDELHKASGTNRTAFINDLVQAAMMQPQRRAPAKPAAATREPSQAVTISIWRDLLEDLDGLVMSESKFTGLPMTRTRVLRRLIAQQLQQKGK